MEEIKQCTCKEYKASRFVGVYWKFCPWCGKKLTQPPPDGHDFEGRPVPRRSQKARKGGFVDAKGVLPWKEGDELSEDAIRRLRHG